MSEEEAEEMMIIEDSNHQSTHDLLDSFEDNSYDSSIVCRDRYYDNNDEPDFAESMNNTVEEELATLFDLVADEPRLDERHPTNDFSVAITLRGSRLDGLELKEPIDVNLVNDLIHTSLITEATGEKKTRQSKKKLLEKYLRMPMVTIDGRDYVKIPYRKYNNQRLGRALPVEGTGLHFLPRQLRHTLAASQLVDIDMVNSGMNILYNLLLNNQKLFGPTTMSTSALTYYVLQREECLSYVTDAYGVSRELAKELYLSLGYGGSLEKWKTKNNVSSTAVPPSISAFIKEIAEIIKIFLHYNVEIANKLREDKLLKGKETKSLGKMLLSTIIEEHESRILETVYLYCVKAGYIENNICVLCCDGIMLETKFFKPELLGELEAIVYEDLGFKVKFIQKPMNEALDLKAIKENRVFDLHLKRHNTDELANYFKLHHSDKFLHVNNLLYRYNDVYWKEQQKDHADFKNFLSGPFIDNILAIVDKEVYALDPARFAAIESENVTHSTKKRKQTTTQSPVEELTEMEKQILQFQALRTYVLQFKNIRNLNNLASHVILKITNNQIEFDARINLLPFENKIYDLETSQWVEPKPEFYITQTTGYSYTNTLTKEEKLVLPQLIQMILPDKKQRDYYMTLLATSMFGRHIDKIIICCSDGGSGKSFLHSFMMCLLGNNFSCILASGCLLKDIPSEGASVQFAVLKNMRMVLSTEPTAGSKFCTATILRLTGDKSLPVRNLYSSEIANIRLLMTLFIECNRIPHWDGDVDLYAKIRRLIVATFSSQFVEEWEVEEKKKLNEHTYKKDLMLMTDEFQKKYRCHFFDILRGYAKQYVAKNYEFPPMPDEWVKVTKETLDDSDYFKRWFQQNYTLQPTRFDNRITVDKLRIAFLASDIYKSLKSTEKQNFTDNKVFKDLIFKPSYFLEAYKVLKDKTIKDDREFELSAGTVLKNRANSDMIVGWKRNVNTDEEPRCA